MDRESNDYICNAGKKNRVSNKTKMMIVANTNYIRKIKPFFFLFLSVASISKKRIKIKTFHH